MTEAKPCCNKQHTASLKTGQTLMDWINENGGPTNSKSILCQQTEPSDRQKFLKIYTSGLTAQLCCPAKEI